MGAGGVASGAFEADRDFIGRGRGFFIDRASLIFGNILPARLIAAFAVHHPLAWLPSVPWRCHRVCALAAMRFAFSRRSTSPTLRATRRRLAGAHSVQVGGEEGFEFGEIVGH